MKKIAVFDFDGTLIKRDSMVLFFSRYFKFLSLHGFLNAPQLLIDTLKFALKLYSRKQYKEKFINSIIDSSKINDIDKLANDFSEYLLTKIYIDARRKIETLKRDGFELVLLSASPDFYLKKIKDKLGFSKLICTKTYYKDRKIIISGKNCYGKNKIKMFLDKYKIKDINWKESYCFSDCSSDKKLLSYFGKSYFINNKKLAKNNPQFKYLRWN